MIVIRSGRDAADHFRRLREYPRATDTLIETAAVFGFQVALVAPEEERMTPAVVPSRRPHTRPTGTGWPA